MRVLRSTAWLAGAAVLVGSFASFTFTPCLALSQTSASEATASPAVAFPPVVRDVLKMLDAKVDPSVIKAYIQNASILFNPTANQIIALKQRGVPDDLIAAIIQRGAEVRAQMVQAAQAAAQASAATAAPPPASAYGTATAPYYPYSAPYSYPYDYSDYGYGYPYYGYSYGYPYWNAYGYPVLFALLLRLWLRSGIS